MTRIERLGDRALRIARPASTDPQQLLEIVRAWPGVVDATITEEWLGVYFAEEAAPLDVAALPIAIDSKGESAGVLAACPRTIDLFVRYDGDDLIEVAREVGLSPDALAEAHQRASYTVLFMGFLPGFAYLGGLPERLVVGRRATPRARVPKNALAIAGPYTGVYPFASPGGWRLIGTLLEPEVFSANGALLQPGDRVRFLSTRSSP